MEPAVPSIIIINKSEKCEAVSILYLATRNPAGIITTSLGNGMKELSIVINTNMKRQNNTGYACEYAANASM